MTAQQDDATDGGDRTDESPEDGASPWWEATLEELALLADDRRESGWKVLTLRATETVPTLPGGSSDGEFGLAYTVSESEADELAARIQSLTVDEFEAYRRTVGTTCFLVTELRDTENQHCVLVAGAYDVGDAEALAEHAAEVGHLFTRFQRLDGTPVAEVRHDAYEKLLPPSLTE